MAEPENGLTEALGDEVGADLRTIGRFTPEEYDIVYQRDDVAARYTAEEIDEIHREQVFEWLNRPYIEELFDSVGELDCTTRWFDDIVVFLVLPDGDERALFVSVDRTDGLDADAVVACCLDAVAA